MSTPTRGFKLDAKRKPSEQFEEGRRCMEAGCITILSRYNPSEYCHAHSPEVIPKGSGARHR